MNTFNEDMQSGNLMKEEPRTRTLMEEADSYLRENPIPVLLGAVAVGVVVGLMVGSMEESRRRDPMRAFIDDLADGVRDRLKPWQRKARRAYASSSERVADAVHDAVERAKNIDVDPVVAPMAAWWKRIWNCG
jgi:ElaB/YqjD/DUF883 family membrane-anchored ribosome-binding protein